MASFYNPFCSTWVCPSWEEPSKKKKERCSFPFGSVQNQEQGVPTPEKKHPYCNKACWIGEREEDLDSASCLLTVAHFEVYRVCPTEGSPKLGAHSLGRYREARFPILCSFAGECFPVKTNPCRKQTVKQNKSHFQ